MLSRRSLLQRASAVALASALPRLPLFAQTAPGAGDDPLQFVDVRIGTGGHGHTYPGASLPFGAVQLSPDTYNDQWEPWTSFADKIAPMYRRLMRIDTRSPISLGEIGCMTTGAPVGQSKATWMTGLFTTTRFPRLSNVVFFDANKEHDWRITSSPDVTAVCRRYLPIARNGR